MQIAKLLIKLVFDSYNKIKYSKFTPSIFESKNNCRLVLKNRPHIKKKWCLLTWPTVVEERAVSHFIDDCSYKVPTCK